MIAASLKSRREPDSVKNAKIETRKMDRSPSAMSERGIKNEEISDPKTTIKRCSGHYYATGGTVHDCIEVLRR